MYRRNDDVYGNYYRRPSVDSTHSNHSTHSAGEKRSFRESPRLASTPLNHGSTVPGTIPITGTSFGNINGSSSTSLGSLSASRKSSLDQKNEDKSKAGLSDLLQSVLDECEDYMYKLDRDQ